MLGRIVDFLRKVLKPRSSRLPGAHIQLNLHPDGFIGVEEGQAEPALSVRWSAVRGIRTYKRDFYAHDMICLAFRVEGDRWVEIMETSPGFMEVGERMREAFPDITPSWYLDVMSPAFERNESVLYQRDGDA